ncbi:hypothetical protein CL6EHI_096680 [Entamoeba histolytica]|uniref:Receptor ligand binding region domain-containing protein n=2 Tax=Entamoeba histolytica TaxID=5759 RepID=A0A175JHL1_ENTHI|nr:hypothetical protein CL6EHI_096680 [Entamoeba histolytica]
MNIREFTFIIFLMFNFSYAKNHVAVSISNLPEDIVYNKTYFDIIDYTFKKLGVSVTLHAYHPDPNNISTVHTIHDQMMKDGTNYAIIGDTITSTTSELIICQDSYVFKQKGQEIPIISNSATSDTLSNKDDYPNFMRTIPVDSASYQSIIEFIHSFKKKKVAMIYTNDPSGNSGYFRVNKLCNQKNIALLGIQYGENMPDMGNLDGIDTIISNMYMEELFDTWKRFPEVLETKMWVLPDAAMVISEADFELNGFKEVLNNKTNVVIASLFSESNDISKELESKFGSPLPPLGKGYYDVVVSLVEGWKKCGNTYNFTKFISSKFTGATGKVLFDSNGDRIGVMGISRLLLGNNGYPVIAQFEDNTIRFVSNWQSFMIGYTESDIQNSSTRLLMLFITFYLFIL